MAYDAKFGLEDFELYRTSRNFRKQLYELMRQLPVEERYCFATQMRRAAVSSDIAEGHGRWYYQENIRFCWISRVSVEELIDDLNVCLDEHYGDQSLVVGLKAEATALIARINSYIAYLRKSKQGSTSLKQDN